MKILWLSHFYPYPPAGGALQRSYHLLRQTASHHDVRLVSLTKTRNRPGLQDAAREYPTPEEFCSEVDTFPIPAESTALHRSWTIASGLWDARPYDARWLESTELRDFLDSELHASSVDLAHLDTIGLAQYDPSLGGVPAVMNHHNVESHMMERRADQADGVLKRLYMQREAGKLAEWESRWCERYERNLVVSELDGARLEESAPEADWTVIANGVDVDYFRPEDRDADTRRGLVFVGRMSWYPNRDAIEWFLDEIWPELVRERGERTLTLVGSSPPTRHIERSDAAGNIRATGFVPDVRPYMNESAIYVCPIRTGGGTRLKILDAMAMGMPLVATSMSVEGLNLEDGEHFLRADSVEEFVAAIGELERDPSLRTALGRRARREAEETYSWTRIGETLSRVYREIT